VACHSPDNNTIKTKRSEVKKESFELTMPAASVVNRILILPFENLGQQSSSSWYFVESYRLQFGSENIQEYGPETI
jgi:hypothetical protein